MNEENLRPRKKGDPGNATFASKGGVASGVARKRKRNLRDAACLLMTCVPAMHSTQRDKIIVQMGLDPDEPLTVAVMTVVQLVQRMLAGDLDAVKLFMELTGCDFKSRSDTEHIKLEREKHKAMAGGASDESRVVINVLPGGGIEVEDGNADR